MKKTNLAILLSAALMLTLTGCGNARPAESEVPDAAAQNTADIQISARDDGQSAASESGRQDGERFETVIMLEGMEEPVRYEHVMNRTAGFEMDYDYESFARRSEADRECFVSLWDDPENPENYLEVTYSTENADSAAASVSEALSGEYSITKETRTLEMAGDCIRIEASEIKDTGRMADQLQTVYIIPASDGCRIATAHVSAESAEGFGRRFSNMLNTLAVIDR